MSEKVKIGIVGYGFVGKAVHYGFSERVRDSEFILYDPHVNTVPNNYKNWEFAKTMKRLRVCDVIFICVPTPTDFHNYTQDNWIMDEVMKDLTYACYGNSRKPIIAIKSTVEPGTTAKYQRKYPSFNFVFNPEFLVEETYLNDFLNQDRIVIGGNDTKPLAKIYKKGWPKKNKVQYYTKLTSTEAELVKYAANAFLATKVSFFNEMYKLCERLECDYDAVTDPVEDDVRIGIWGTFVPGKDGQFGFGGKCFPKDIVTLIGLTKRLGVPNNVINGAWETNEVVRNVKDWFNIKGASSNE